MGASPNFPKAKIMSLTTNAVVPKRKIQTPGPGAMVQLNKAMMVITPA